MKVQWRIWSLPQYTSTYLGILKRCSDIWQEGLKAIKFAKLTRLPKSNSTPHRQTPLFIKSWTRIVQILLLSSINGHFAVIILTPLKTFFYYGFGQRLLLIQMSRHIWSLHSEKEFCDICGWGQWSLNDILF